MKMVLKADQLRVKALLTETITLLCKNGLHFKTKFSIEGLMGITLDDEDIFLVNINETIRTAEAVQEVDDGCSALEQLPSSVKIVRDKAEVVANKVSPQLTESPASATVKSLDTSSSIKKFSSNSRTRSLRSSCQTSPLSIAVKPARPVGVPGTAGASSGITAFSGSSDSVGEIGNNDSRPASSVGLSECESQTFSSDPLKTDKTPGDGDYDDNKTLLTDADFSGQPNKRIRLGSSGCVTESTTLASTSSEASAVLFVPKQPTKSEPPDVIEIKEESLSDSESQQQPNYSAYGDYNNPVPYGSSNTELMQGFADSSMFQANSGFFIPQQGEVNDNSDWFGQRQSRRIAPPKSTKVRGTYECQRCNQKFTWMAALLQHENNKHGRRPHPFLCQICSKGFWNQRDLRGHLGSKHRMQKDFQCMICGREYSYKAYLKVHMRTCHSIGC